MLLETLKKNANKNKAKLRVESFLMFLENLIYKYSSK